MPLGNSRKVRSQASWSPAEILHALPVVFAAQGREDSDDQDVEQVVPEATVAARIRDGREVDGEASWDLATIGRFSTYLLARKSVVVQGLIANGPYS